MKRTPIECASTRPIAVSTFSLNWKRSLVNSRPLLRAVGLGAFALTLLLGLANRAAAQVTTLEAENLSPVGSGATVSTGSDTSASGGVVVYLNSTGTGQTMTLTTPSLAAATYQVQLRYKTNTSRGQMSLKIDGTQVGGTLDQYASTSGYLTATMGNTTLAAGSHSVVLTVTGKNASSSGYILTADSLILTAAAQPQVATPSFTPAAGTYSSAQSVTIATTTSGASIRYTTDGSTPTSTTGTLYSGAVNIGSTTTLKAIAYESGFTNSNVASGTYTISATPPPTVTLEAENLSPVGSGATVSTGSDTNASGGVVEYLNATGTGQTMTLTTPSIAAATYQVQFRYKTNTSRGQLTLKIDGTQVGGTVDEYASSASYVTTTLGSATLAAGAHSIVLTVTGKNSSSTSYVISADSFTFTPSSGTTNYTAAQILAGVQAHMTSSTQVNTKPHINTMTRAMDVNVYQVSTGVFAYTSSMAIDTDGSDPDPDPDHQSQTTWTDDNGAYLGAHHVPYYVLGDYCYDKVSPCPHFYYAEHNITGLQFALIFYNGKCIGAVFGDTQGDSVTPTSDNDSRELGEASVESAVLLGIPSSGTTGGVDNGVTVVIFSGSTWIVHGTNTTLNANAQALVQKALNTLGNAWGL
jgi:hypothetical protein